MQCRDALASGNHDLQHRRLQINNTVTDQQIKIKQTYVSMRVRVRPG
jgi:hypothetical protein